MSKKLVIKIISCGLLMLPLRADTNFVTSQTKTFATNYGASAQTVVTGDPAELENTQSVCVGLTCNNDSFPSTVSLYNWSSQLGHGGECQTGLRVTAITDHTFDNGEDFEATVSWGSHDCQLVPE